MTYYTDYDRKKAAAKRKMNSQFRQLRESPQDFYDIFGVSVPRVTTKPELAYFGLTDGVEERLKIADEQNIAKEKSSRKIIASVITVTIICLIWYAFSQMSEANHPENYVNGQLTNTALGWWGAIFTLGGIFGVFPLWTWVFNVKPEQTFEHMKFKQYKDQLSYFEHWQRKRDKNHWNNMTGHAFEKAVANLFRDIGFAAQVSKQGGDGGVDIILQKADRRIAVQCKRYKSSVGPHVIRDLWGTMHHLGYDEGCIVTTTGFTKGVTEFAKERGIFLIDLNDILRATSDENNAYLSRKIGE
jgi:restriction system protein